MTKYFEEEKWSDDRVKYALDLMSGMIVDAFPMMGISLPSGRYEPIVGYMNSVIDNCIREEWVDGILIETRAFVLQKPGIPQHEFVFEMNMSQYEPYYAVFNEIGGVVIYCEEFEEVVEALLRIRDGKPPYEYNTVLAKQNGWPVEEAFDFDPDNIREKEGKTIRVWAFGGENEE